MNSVAVLPEWHGVAEATPKKPHATPQATPNENMNFGSYRQSLHSVYMKIFGATPSTFYATP